MTRNLRACQLGDAFWAYACLKWIYVKKGLSQKASASLIDLLASKDFQLYLCRKFKPEWLGGCFDGNKVQNSHDLSQIFEARLTELSDDDFDNAMNLVFGLLDQAFCSINLKSVQRLLTTTVNSGRWHYQKEACGTVHASHRSKDLHGTGTSEGRARFNAVFTHWFPPVTVEQT